jgi:hypothetical protein
MDRTKAIFDWIFGIENDFKDVYQLYYLAPQNVGLTEQAVLARKEREAKSQKTVEEILAPKYQTMKGVWSFLTQDHALYTAHKLVERGRATSSGTTSEDKALKESYGLSQNKNGSL